MLKERNITFYQTWERILDVVRSFMGLLLFFTACYGLGVIGLLDTNEITVLHALARTGVCALLVASIIGIRKGLTCLRVRSARKRLFLSTGIDMGLVF